MTRQTVARAIHENYVRHQIGAGGTQAVPWEELPENLKESNRRQADDIERKLRAIGCRIVQLAEGSERFEFSAYELDHLARVEHDRWKAEREADGWIYGADEDIQAKRTPNLVSYDELPDEIQELDRDAVRAIPDVLANAGLGVVRFEREESDESES